MSTALRQILLFFIVVLVVKCSQWPTTGYKFRAPRPGKRSYVLDNMSSDEHSEEADSGYRRSFIRIGRSPREDMDGMMPVVRSRPKKDSAFLRIGRSDPQKRESFLRLGRGSDDRNNMGYIRIGRAMEADKRAQFLRIGRSYTGEDNTMGYIRMGRPMQTDQESGYFAFPRQGRAMSFYFPRMGRSGDDVTSESDCCPEGVRNVFAMSKGAFEICPRSKPCCSGFEEKAKLYSNVVLTECTRDTSLDKIRELMTEN